jgi:hypothetical protein
MAVTFTQSQIDAFVAAMLANPGVLRMRFADREYEFETLEAKREFLAYMQQNISTGQTGRTRYAVTDKGV